MHTIRFIMLGGFLGAGKTTALGRLARFYMGRGERVGLITNDQAADLVDTHMLRGQGLTVEEVAGACFCCKFDELLEKIGALEAAQQPHVILAEPVGSCTDLVATVIQPLKDLYGARFTVAPYGVLFKPSHGLKILRNEAGAGFSPKAAYIFRKQLEEADLILVNRSDELSGAQQDEISRLVAVQYPGTPVLPISASSGAGFEALTQFLDREGDFGQKILDIDYDIYAAGEAELGWLNSSLGITAEQAFPLDKLLLDVVQGLQTALAAAGAEVAHLKAIGLCARSFGVANVVSNASQAVLSLPSRCQVKEADLVINARVAVDPVVLQEHVEAVVAAVCRDHGAKPMPAKTQSFRPGRPQPTHRYAKQV
jgi:Ni2+-binding GTPase involved in maturation of urease and hydrogenase